MRTERVLKKYNISNIIFVDFLPANGICTCQRNEHGCWLGSKPTTTSTPTTLTTNPTDGWDPACCNEDGKYYNLGLISGCNVEDFTGTYSFYSAAIWPASW